MTDYEKWLKDGEDNGWKLPTEVQKWKCLPIIRHIRFIRHAIQLDEYHRFCHSMGMLPSGYDNWYLYAIRIGKA